MQNKEKLQKEIKDLNLTTRILMWVILSQGYFVATGIVKNLPLAIVIGVISTVIFIYKVKQLIDKDDELENL
jgi:hypothetical protein